MVSSVNKSLQLSFRLFWIWREMNMLPSQTGSKLIWRKAKGCFARQRKQMEADWQQGLPLRRGDGGGCVGGDRHRAAAQRTAYKVIKRGKKFTFIDVKLEWVCGCIIRRGFLCSCCSEHKKQHIFLSNLFLYKSMKNKKVCGSEGRTSVTDCGIRLRKQRSA